MAVDSTSIGRIQGLAMDATGEFEARVRDLTPKGLGVIDHPDGRVVFVPGVWPGDVGLFRLT
ncbi:MAG: hypothetical protein KDD43_04260, partial [Bdellovibrionales bacterium]|nr:hypothetical protein [Bdellovibrionales bacterium]